MKLRAILGDFGTSKAGTNRADPPVRTWPLVAFGFGMMLVLGVAVTVITLDNVAHFRNSVLDVTDAHQNRREQIEALRSQIYVSSILIRDYLLENKDGATATYRERLQKNRAAAALVLEELRQSSMPGSRSTMRSLTDEVDAYWRSLDALLRVTDEDTVSPYEYIRTTIIPRRQAVISLAEELADAGLAQARDSREALVSSLDDYQRNSVALRIVTTALAVALALFTTFRVLRLERAAIAEHARLEQAEEEMRHLSQQVVESQEQERRSLSRELHDHVGQLVTALRFGLTDLERQVPAPSREFSATLAQCRTMLEQTIEAVRGIAMGLRPSMLDDLGLAAAIEWQGREFSKRFNLPVTVIVDPNLTDWPEPQRTALYRVAQEALTNCARHSRAKSVRIELSQLAEAVKLSIIDDGVGLPSGQRPRGFGLIGMEERVREIGGTLNLRSASGGGTILEVLLPLRRVVTNA